MKTEAGNLLPSTLMMLSHEPQPFDISASETYQQFIRTSSQTSEPAQPQQNFRPFKRFSPINTSGGENDSSFMAAQTSFNKFLREPVPPKPREKETSLTNNNFRSRVKYPAIEARVDSLDYEEEEQGSKSLLYEKKKLPPLPKSGSINFDKGSVSLLGQEKGLTPVRSRAEPEGEFLINKPFSKEPEKDLTPMRSRAEPEEEFSKQKPFSNPKGYVKPEPENLNNDRNIKDLEHLLKVATQRRIEEENRLREQQAKECGIS